jgi:U2 small nuclear ribonucleoprotein A'
MRITAELITELVEHRINALEERELCLGGLGIIQLEHLGAARNDFDAYDLSNNRIRRLENFPKVLRLTSLYVANNLVESIDVTNLQTNVPHLRHLVLCENAVTELRFVQQLATACPHLEFLSLQGNPLTRTLPNFRSAVVYLLPQLKCLDYERVTKTDRTKAAAWGKSAAGVAALASATNQDSSSGTTHKTFEPGESLSDAAKEDAKSFVTAHFTAEQKAQIRQLLAEASSVQEMEEIEAAVRKGIMPTIRAPKATSSTTMEEG